MAVLNYEIPNNGLKVTRVRIEKKKGRKGGKWKEKKQTITKALDSPISAASSAIA